MGRVGKPHGLRGDVVVTLTSNRPERAQAGAVLVAGDAALRVEWARPLGARWVMRFTGVDTREKAEALRGAVLCAEPLEDDDAWWVHDLVGCAVEDEDGRRLGRVEAVLPNPASDLLELDGGGLVPLRFVVARHAGRLVVSVPDGLLDPPA